MSKRTITLAVEGDGDVPIAKKLAELAGFDVGPIYGLSGKGKLDRQLTGYNSAARFAPWLVIRDLDHDAECAAEKRKALLPEPSRQMCFRIAVREAESWLLADRHAFARFAGVRIDLVPLNPDSLSDPRAELLRVVARGKRDIRFDMVPRPGSRAAVGRAYTARLVEYGTCFWRPLEGAKSSESLRRGISALRRLAAQR